MARPTRAANIDDKIDALKRIRQGASPELTKLILDASLKDTNWLIVSEACATIVQLSLRDFNQLLLEIWPRFIENAVKRDPGCRAKEAALKALDYAELLDPDPFLTAIRYKQFEPVLGGKVDTAGALRVRSLQALLRMSHSKAALFAGELMADSDAQVRAGAAQAIGFYANTSSSALLTYKLREGDDDPAVLLECALALLSTDAEFGLGILVPNLSGKNALNRETAALALGQCRDTRATQALLEWTEGIAIDEDHNLAIRALGLSRDESARRYLFGLVESGAMVRARAAVEALAVHRYDRQLTQLVRNTALRRGNADLREFVERVFGATEVAG